MQLEKRKTPRRSGRARFLHKEALTTRGLGATWGHRFLLGTLSGSGVFSVPDLSKAPPLSGTASAFPCSRLILRVDKAAAALSLLFTAGSNTGLIP